MIIMIIIMALTQVDFDDEEEKQISKLSDEWNLNKPKTIKRIVKEFLQSVRSRKEVKS